MGCALGCQCGWQQHCYRKSALFEGSDELIEVGECSLSMTWLVLSAIGVFWSALAVIVALRLTLLGSCCAGDELDQALSKGLPPIAKPVEQRHPETITNPLENRHPETVQEKTHADVIEVDNQPQTATHPKLEPFESS